MSHTTPADIASRNAAARTAHQATSTRLRAKTEVRRMAEKANVEAAEEPKVDAVETSEPQAAQEEPTGFEKE